MKFGPVAPDEALGALAAHTVRAEGLLLKKGTLIGAADIAALKRAGVAQVVVARLDADELDENAAATLIASAVAGPGVRVEAAASGRVNLHAETAGVLVLDTARIHALNALHEAITLATLPPFKAVLAGEMIGTVKIIPFGVPSAACAAARAALGAEAPLRVAPYRLRKVGLVATLLPGLPEKVLAKTAQVTAARLAPAEASILREHHVTHQAEAVAAALQTLRDEGAELIVMFGASAIVDRRDVLPAALERAGGRVEHFGMPVDPGNLMLLGKLDGIPVIGAPGCARSPVENGFDWILMRLLAGLAVAPETITGMGVGGLLKDIVTRPHPRRAHPASPPAVTAVVLAAGQGRRMGVGNKLLMQVAGRPMVRHVVEQALASRADPVIVVTGHDGGAVREALAGLPVQFVDNPASSEGIASSIRAGIAAIADDAQGALICLGDMPLVDRALLDALIEGFAPAQGALIVVPVRDGRRGNPVLWSRRFFPQLMQLEGDVGARHLLERYGEITAEVAVEDAAAFLDVDTPETLAALNAPPDQT